MNETGEETLFNKNLFTTNGQIRDDQSVNRNLRNETLVGRTRLGKNKQNIIKRNLHRMTSQLCQKI